MHGFFIIDKPEGITSHDVVSRVRKIVGTRKVGHTGTLDPFATGVLPVAVNDGTKAIIFLDEGIKKYEALLRLGVSTDTLDMTGTVLNEKNPSNITRQQFHQICSRFTGSLTQIPPMYSAIKQDGQPLYKLARQGVEVERKPRHIEIYSLEICTFDLPLATIRVSCSRGTYIRTLADDIGRELGCGAALQELRRTASGLFSIEKALTLEQLETYVKDGNGEQILISPFSALGHLSDIPLNASGMKKLSFGVAPQWSDTMAEKPHQTETVTLVRLSNNAVLAAIAELIPQSGCPPRFVLKRVFAK